MVMYPDKKLTTNAAKRQSPLRRLPMKEKLYTSPSAAASTKETGAVHKALADIRCERASLYVGSKDPSRNERSAKTHKLRAKNADEACVLRAVRAAPATRRRALAKPS